MKRYVLHILLLQPLMVFLPLSLALARTDRPVEVTPEQIERLPEIGRLNLIPIRREVSSFQVVDINNDGFDEIICKFKDLIDLNALSGQKLRRMNFPFPLHGWNVLNVNELGGSCVFIFREVNGWARMEVYNAEKELLSGLNLCPVNDLDGSGSLDLCIDVFALADLNGDQNAELIIRLATSYDLYPRGLIIIDLQRWQILRENPTAGSILNIHLMDIDMDKMPDFLISTHAPSNGAVVGDWDDSQSVLLGIRGFDGSVLWRRIIGGPLSFVQHRLIDLDGDGQEEILVAEYSEFEEKERNTSLRIFKLPDAVEVRMWECPTRGTLIDCFTAWGRGQNSTILIGFNNGDLVKFNTELHPLPLYHFNTSMTFIHDVDLNDDGQKEVLIGLKDEPVIILNHELLVVGRQNFAGPPVSVRAPEVEFGKFVVISEGKVYRWSLTDVEFHPPPSKFIAWLQRWGLYVFVLVILIAAGVLYIHRRIKNTVISEDTKSSGESSTMPNFAELVLSEEEKENIRKKICKEIISKREGNDTFDYLIFLLGNEEIYTGTGELLITHRRGYKWKVLLYYLVANRTQQIHKEKLMDLLWRNSQPKRAVQNLYLAIHRLNQELSISGKEKFIIFTAQCYSINPEYKIFIDVQEFKNLVSQSDRLIKDNQLDLAIDKYLTAIRLYAGDYMTNLYESWCDPDRENLRNMYRHALRQVGLYLLDRGQSDVAVGYFRKALKIDEYSEELYIDIMRCYAASGNKKAVEEEYQRLCKLFREELDADPREETNRIYQSLTK